MPPPGHPVAGGRPGAGWQGSPLPAPQERIGRLFQSDGRWHRRHAGLAARRIGGNARAQCGIAGFHGMGKAQVGKRVFVRAIHQGVIRQRRQRGERCRHLRRRTFEDAATAGAEQRVAAKQPSLLPGMIGNMAARMAGHSQHTERQAEFRHVDASRHPRADLLQRQCHRGADHIPELANAATIPATPPTWSAWRCVSKIAHRDKPCDCKTFMMGMASPGSTAAAWRPSWISQR